MISVGVGYSVESSTGQAAVEAATMAMAEASLAKADIAVVFATVDHRPFYPLLLKKVQQTTQAPHLVGCSALGLVTTHGEIMGEPGIAVMVLSSPDISVTTFLLRQLEKRSEAIGREIGRIVNAQRRDSSLLILLPDTFTLQSRSFFHAIHKEAGRVDVVGGGASEDGNETQTYQFCGGEVDSNAVAGALLSGQFTATIGLSQACHPVGDPVMVTKARGNRILELGGRPAYEVFATLFRDSLDEDPRTLAHSVFIGLPTEASHTHLARGEYLVRNIIGVDPRQGGLTVAEEVSEGQVVSFALRDPRRACKDIAEMVSDLSRVHHGHPPRLGLYFNCCGRGPALYGKPDIDLTIIKRYFGEMPLIGFFSYAEIAPVRATTFLHTYSGILVLISDPIPSS